MRFIVCNIPNVSKIIKISVKNQIVKSQNMIAFYYIIL